ncbi:MAG TPA: DNA polymerase III subunit gamma/tau C-terminal domain-containing protein, partial [Methylococcales bacterium]
DFSDVLQQILLILHRVALVQLIPGAVDHDFDTDMITVLSSSLTPEDVQLFYQIGLVGQKDLDLAPDPRSGFEMVMLRMLTFRPVTTEQPAVKPVQIKETAAKPQIKAPQPDAGTVHRNESPVDTGERDWLSMIIAMKLTGPAREFATNCVLENIDDKVCNLIVDPDYIRGARAEETLQKALQAYLCTPIKLVIKAKKTTIDTPAVQLTKEREDKQQAAVEAINSDHNIQALKDHFDARVIPGTIEPV